MLAYDHATQLLTQHRRELDRLAATLTERESLEREDLTALLMPGTAPAPVQAPSHA